MVIKSFDLETNGKDPLTARIWQVATNEREWIVNPCAPISDEIRELCHIDDALMARIESAPVWDDVAGDVIAHLRDCDALVTQNGIKYDVPVLDNEYHSTDVSVLPPVIDVRVLAFEAWPDIGSHMVGDEELTGHKLTNVALHLGLTTPEEIIASAHDAQWDCKLALEVFHRLPPKWIEDLPRLMAFQERSIALQTSDWERFGVTPEDGPKFLWFRTCRNCIGKGVVKQSTSPASMGRCYKCGSRGFVHQTHKRRGQPVDAGYLRWMREKCDTCPKELR